MYKRILKKDLEHILHITASLTSIRDINGLFNFIINEARILTNCDAGTIYIKRNEDTLDFLVTQSYCLANRYGKELVNSLFKPYPLPINTDSIAGYCAINKKVLNIHNLQKLKKNVPYKYNDSFDKKYGYHTESMLVSPLINVEGELIGVLQLINKKDTISNKIIPFDKHSEKLLKILSLQAAVAIQNTLLSTRLDEAYKETVLKLAIAAEYRDKETYNHLIRMSEYSYLIAKELGFNDEYASRIKSASLMHDVGKIGIPDKILFKPASLTSEERIIMQKHAAIGAVILMESQSDLLKIAAQIALTHHERWDGSGYPLGIKNENIPIEGRIVALADVFDALTSARVYKPKMNNNEVFTILIAEKEKHFDPRLVDLFIKKEKEITEIQNTYRDSEGNGSHLYSLNNNIIDLSDLIGESLKPFKLKESTE